MSASPLRASISSVPAYVPGRRATSALTASLASNESHFDPLPSVLAALASASGRVNRYPDSQSTALRAALAERLSVDPAQVTVGAGSLGVLRQAIEAVCDRDDEVVHAWRSFEAYPVLIGIAGARSVPVPLRADEGHDLPAMVGAVTSRTRMIILCSPNNPTGTIIDAAALREFLHGVPRRVLVVIDEAYLEYVDAELVADSVGLLGEHPNLCVLRSFSKAHGLAGLRIGYAVSSVVVADALRRTATPFAVSSVAHDAAVASVAARQELRDRVREVVQERTRVIDAARRAGWSLPDSHANFVWLPIDGERRTELVDAFTAADVLVRTYSAPHAGIRITLADRATNDRVLQVLEPGERRGPQGWTPTSLRPAAADPPSRERPP